MVDLLLDSCLRAYSSTCLSCCTLASGGLQGLTGCAKRAQAMAIRQPSHNNPSRYHFSTPSHDLGGAEQTQLNAWALPCPSSCSGDQPAYCCSSQTGANARRG